MKKALTLICWRPPLAEQKHKNILFASLCFDRINDHLRHLLLSRVGI